ncbi:MAG: hypothetical protein DRJ03_30745 [Chloroflexi bacterium]|nr:MAG: hypothetical protein DRJ03_30745 [Chloroflexota bacterium]
MAILRDFNASTRFWWGLWQRLLPAPAKRLNTTVRRRLHRQSSGKDEKESHMQAIMRPSFKRVGL